MKARCSYINILIVVLAAMLYETQYSGFTFWTGNQLMDSIKSYERMENGTPSDSIKDGASAVFCLAYIKGVVEASYISLQGVMYEIPSSVEYTQLVAVVSKYLKAHPEEWSQPACVLINMALVDAFPVKTKMPTVK